MREDLPGDQRIVAYVVPAAGAPDLDEVRAGAAELLPSYMVPTAFVVLDRIPLTVNGKLDRRALPAPRGPGARRSAHRRPRSRRPWPRCSPTCSTSSRVGLDDDFFELGGNSLIATRVVARISDALGVDVAVRALFEASTVEALAAKVETAYRRRGAGRGCAPRPRPELVPLSFAQQRMWFLNQYDTDVIGLQPAAGHPAVG